MTRYRKKPVEIEAVQFTGDNVREIAEFMGIPLAGLQVSVDAVLRMDGDYSENTHIHIPTLEGTMTANYGDWIIKGVKGEFYPCKPDIFDETYMIVEGVVRTYLCGESDCFIGFRAKEIPELKRLFAQSESEDIRKLVGFLEDMEADIWPREVKE